MFDPTRSAGTQRSAAPRRLRRLRRLRRRASQAVRASPGDSSPWLKRGKAGLVRSHANWWTACSPKQADEALAASSLRLYRYHKATG
mmetsp:Transcript_61308/g.134228  ORF Transcript_61308/g.134228 Transcript_61308/m.134228 type:complete len:87 (+) Transcript_61308:349-609(+)